MAIRINSIAIDMLSQRLNLNHKILKQLIGRNFRGPVNAVLALNPARPPRVLDLGTGKGKWCVISVCFSTSCGTYQGVLEVAGDVS